MYLDFWGSTVHILCGTAYGFVAPNSNSIAQTGTEVNKVTTHSKSPHAEYLLHMGTCIIQKILSREPLPRLPEPPRSGAGSSTPVKLRRLFPRLL